MTDRGDELIHECPFCGEGSAVPLEKLVAWAELIEARGSPTPVAVGRHAAFEIQNGKLLLRVEKPEPKREETAK